MQLNGLFLMFCNNQTLTELTTCLLIVLLGIQLLCLYIKVVCILHILTDLFKRTLHKKWMHVLKVLL